MPEERRDRKEGRKEAVREGEGREDRPKEDEEGIKKVPMMREEIR